MAWCPITKSDCRPDCAWFKENRRKYQDHIEGECFLVGISRIPNGLKNINDSITALEQTIHNKEF